MRASNKDEFSIVTLEEITWRLNTMNIAPNKGWIMDLQSLKHDTCINYMRGESIKDELWSFTLSYD